MNDKTKKIILYVTVALLLVAVGFFIGRSQVKTKTITFVKYTKSEPVIIHKDSLIPVYITKPADTTNIILAAVKSGKFTDMFPVRDSLIYVTKEDTTAVITDWATERIYSETLFDIDTVGTEIVNLVVKYNRLQEISGKFTPVVKNVETTVLSAKKFSPFIGGGITTSPEVIVNAGMFFDEKYGVSAIYEYDFVVNKHVFGMTALYKF